MNGNGGVFFNPRNHGRRNDSFPMIWKALVIIILVVGILGSGAFFTFKLFVQPKQELKEEIATVPVPTPTPDPSLAAYEALVQTRKSADLPAARDAYRNFLDEFPDSPKRAEAKAELGEINMDILLSTFASPEKVSYTVVRGDALVKIANKTNADAELIMRSNNLPTINLQIGQQLLVPQIQASLLIDREAKTVTLLDAGKFVKEYPLLSLANASAGETKILDKIATKDDKRVAFGSKEYVDSLRTILMASAGLSIQGVPEAAEGETPAPPVGTSMKQSDIEELFLFVSRGTPVSIQ